MRIGYLWIRGPCYRRRGKIVYFAGGLSYVETLLLRTTEVVVGGPVGGVQGLVSYLGLLVAFFACCGVCVCWLVVSIREKKCFCYLSRGSLFYVYFFDNSKLFVVMTRAVMR